ncbi:hypothetical protein K1T34_41375 [Amycolatopsis sp. DSM 110486]|nr:hypothetical protein K1T34_41375 [Amycolatopsis sp. DSM 110486]
MRIEIRDAYYSGWWRNENEWPIKRTVHKPLFLDAATASVTEQPVPGEATVSYDATATEITATFSYTFAEDTEITGTPR